MKQPRLRFKADDGSDFPDWESKSFSDVFTGLRNNTLSRNCLNNECGQAKNIHYGDVLIKYGSVVDIQTDGVPFVNSDIDCKRWDCLRDGDILIADTAEDDTVGKVVEIMNVGSDTLFSGLHTIACRPRDAFASKYLGYYMNSKAYHDQLRPYMQGIKVTSVSKSNIALTHLEIPSLPEQRKIADLLSTVDSVIAAQQAEVDAWEQRKKGVVQKLFSQEVRFKADDGSDFPDWDEKTLGELTNLFVGKSFTSELSENGHYVVMDMGSVSPDGSIIDTKLTDSARDLLDKDDLIMPKDDIGGGLIIGKTAYIPCDGKYVCGDHVYRLRFGKGVDGLFMHYDINSTGPQKRLARKVTGSAQLGLNSKNVSSETISIPSLSEQRKIANCLSSIDDVIAKEKAELAKWQELKKGLLQQMFV